MIISHTTLLTQVHRQRLFGHGADENRILNSKKAMKAPEFSVCGCRCSHNPKATPSNFLSVTKVQFGMNQGINIFARFLKVMDFCAIVN